MRRRRRRRRCADPVGAGRSNANTDANAYASADFGTGDLLQLQGTVTIDWTAADTAVAGAQRSWRIAIERGWRRPAALPFDWTFGDYAPTTLAFGTAS